MKSLNAELAQSDFNFANEKGPARTGERLPIKALQFGEGNFLRAFVDWMLDELNRSGEFNGRVAVVQPIENGLVDMLNEQDCLYTLMMRGVQNGEVKEQRQIVSSIDHGLNPYKQWSELTELACSDDLRFVFSNTTEAGIAHVDEDYTRGTCQTSFPAKVTSLLFERFKAGTGGLVFIPCELIERNGDNLKRIVLQYAEEWKLGDDFCKWVCSDNFFLNTLVDRIVPGYPREEVETLTEEFGYKDNLIVAAEIFHLWVIEGPEKLAEELPFHKVGLNVVWTDDMTPYRTRKVRILNGAHTSSVPAAFHAGRNTVGEMLDDSDFKAYLTKAIFEEIIPTMTLPEEELKVYAEAVLERFSNPFIRHELLSISLNSVSKWKVRVMPSLLDYLEKKGELPAALTFSLAALIYFYNGLGGTGKRGDEEYSIRDNKEIVEFMEAVWEKGDIDELVECVLSNESFWGRDLTEIACMKDRVTENLKSIAANGVRQTVKSLIGG